MSINFSTLQGLRIPEGNVVEIKDASGRVLWAVSGGKVILEVEKITSDTYAGETTYTGEQFILLDIYPKTNGTVTVTYGGLTKTITDTSGAAEPNAQQVFFGTFNGVSDEVDTPVNGTLTIEGDCSRFRIGSYNKAKSAGTACFCITAITSFGKTSEIESYVLSSVLGGSCTKVTNIKIPSTIKTIRAVAFFGCTGLTRVTISDGVSEIGTSAFLDCTNLTSVNILADVPPTLGTKAFLYNTGESDDNDNIIYEVIPNLIITVNAGRGATYKAADGWSEYADIIVEAS